MTSVNETQSEKVASNQQLVGCLAGPVWVWLLRSACGQCKVFRAVLG